MTAIPRRRQKQIFIRSDKAAKILTRLAQNGRTKVSILEDALLCAVVELDEEEAHDPQES